MCLTKCQRNDFAFLRWKLPISLVDLALSHFHCYVVHKSDFIYSFWNQNSMEKVAQKIIGIHEKKIDFFYTASARYEIETPQSCNFESFLRIPWSVRKFPKKYSRQIIFILLIFASHFLPQSKKILVFLNFT